LGVCTLIDIQDTVLEESRKEALMVANLVHRRVKVRKMFGVAGRYGEIGWITKKEGEYYNIIFSDSYTTLKLRRWDFDVLYSRKKGIRKN
jgi:hypothetical protein